MSWPPFEMLPGPGTAIAAPDAAEQLEIFGIKVIVNHALPPGAIYVVSEPYKPKPPPETPDWLMRLMRVPIRKEGIVRVECCT